MIDDRDDASLRTLLADVEPPAGLAAGIARAVRTRAPERATPTLDVTVSARGIAGLRLGGGLTVAAGARERGWATAARAQVAEYLAGARAFFSVPLDLAAVPTFQRDVLRAAAAIPFGTVRPYAWIAARIGRPRAVRAVGTALATNPLPLLLPCHRVVRSDGALGGYIFGRPFKGRLLALEHQTPLYVGSATTRILCVHGCAHERRIRAGNRVVFASVADARGVGYRPCAVCDAGEGVTSRRRPR